MYGDGVYHERLPVINLTIYDLGTKLWRDEWTVSRFM